MYVWRRLATRRWWIDQEAAVHALAGDKLALIEEPKRKRLQVEVAAESRSELRALARKFGGQIRKLPRAWLKRFLREQKTKPLKIGRRLLISNVGGTSVSRPSRREREANSFPYSLIIPAGAAFGTGEHATTAMCLRMLERVMKSGRDGSPSRPSNLSDASDKRPYRLVVDLGTGSGILALAASRLGARRVVGIDNDPLAISTAKENARRNKIDNVQFRAADVRQWKPPGKIDIVTANLFSDLLIEILSKLKRFPRLILSGILREQEVEVMRALKRNKIDIIEVRRRGKWVAILAGQLRRS
jgi:ribosomal protein L11 methyltransferase